MATHGLPTDCFINHMTAKKVNALQVFVRVAGRVQVRFEWLRFFLYIRNSFPQ